jgi:hypothetical protein
MITKSKSLFRLLLTLFILFTSIASTTGIGFAEDAVIEVSGSSLVTCEGVVFTTSWAGGTGPYLVQIMYGDEDSDIQEVNANSTTFTHSYIDFGVFEWSVTVVDSENSTTFTDILTLESLEASLSSDPFPPVFSVGEGDATVEFTASASGGTAPYEYFWDLNGDGEYDGLSGNVVSITYEDVGKIQPQVMVTDDCGLFDIATLPVVISDPENACHPTAQKIADAINTIYPDQAGDLYTCEDIYDFFDGADDGSNLGFGRMWKAYNLALTMEELTWEDILDWKLNQSGWGSLLQLNRFAELLEEHSITDLMGLVMSPEYSLGDVRTAVRSATRYEADFEDALTRISEGATPGELGQLYKLAQDLEVDPTEIDGYLESGLTLSELKQSAKLADRLEVDWTEIAEARTSADNWGDIKQAYQLATDEVSAAEILIYGVKDFRRDLRETERGQKETKQAEQQEQKTAEKLAEQFTAEFGDVMNLFNGECEGDWACVRKALRKQEQTTAGGPSEKDTQTALQISSKYGYSVEEILEYNKTSCNGDWACTRAYFRNLSLGEKQTGKDKKK